MLYWNCWRYYDITVAMALFVKLLKLQVDHGLQQWNQRHGMKGWREQWHGSTVVVSVMIHGFQYRSEMTVACSWAAPSRPVKMACPLKLLSQYITQHHHKFNQEAGYYAVQVRSSSFGFSMVSNPPYSEPPSIGFRIIIYKISAGILEQTI